MFEYRHEMTRRIVESGDFPIELGVGHSRPPGPAEPTATTRG
jgi:hypothetical protein